jgi:hypothetical protein
VGQRRKYAHGLVVDDNRGAHLVLHTGGRAGYGSIFMFLPREHVAVAIVANRTGAIFSSAAFLAVESYLGAPLHDAAHAAGDLPITAKELAAIAGTYVNGSLKVELAAQDGRLVLRLADRTLPIRRTGPWSFHIDNGRQLEDFVIVPDAGGVPRYLAADVGALRKRS